MRTSASEKYLPLSESTYYIMLALIEPCHGYAVMQKVAEMSTHAVRVGPGTLYGAFAKLEEEGMIRMVQEEERRKVYTLTEKGKLVLTRQIARLEVMTRCGLDAMPSLVWERR